MPRKRPGITELYRTRSDSLSTFNIACADVRAGAVPASQGIECPYEWSRGGRAGSHPSCAGSEQLGDRGAERCGRALRDEAYVVGLQNEEASYHSACRGPTATQRRRCSRPRLSAQAVEANRLPVTVDPPET